MRLSCSRACSSNGLWRRICVAQDVMNVGPQQAHLEGASCAGAMSSSAKPLARAAAGWWCCRAARLSPRGSARPRSCRWLGSAERQVGHLVLEQALGVVRRAVEGAGGARRGAHAAAGRAPVDGAGARLAHPAPGGAAPHAALLHRGVAHQAEARGAAGAAAGAGEGGGGAADIRKVCVGAGPARRRERVAGGRISTAACLQARAPATAARTASAARAARAAGAYLQVPAAAKADEESASVPSTDLRPVVVL